MKRTTLRMPSEFCTKLLDCPMVPPLPEHDLNELGEGQHSLYHIQDVLEILQLIDELLEQGQNRRAMILLKGAIANLECHADVLRVMFEKLLD